MEEEVKISIVIICNNTKFYTEQCLYSVSAATYGLEAEIFVVDNNSPDGAAEYLAPLFPAVEFIRNEETLPAVQIHNNMLRKLAGEYVLFLDTHLIIGEDSIRTFCFFMDENPDVGAVGAQVLDAHGSFIPDSKRCFPTFWTSFCRKTGLSSLFPNSPRFNKYYLPYLDRNKKHRVDVVSSSFMMFRRSVIEKTGWPDEMAMKYEEEVEVARRLAENKFKCYYLPERVLHYGEGAGKRKYPHRRLLAIAYEESFKEIKKACANQMPDLEFVNLWNLNENRVMSAISRANQMKGFTDIAVCYPDVRFEQLMMLMDRMESKSITYHLYNKKNGVLISPKE